MVGIVPRRGTALPAAYTDLYLEEASGHAGRSRRVSPSRPVHKPTKCIPTGTAHPTWWSESSGCAGVTSRPNGSRPSVSSRTARLTKGGGSTGRSLHVLGKGADIGHPCTCGIKIARKRLLLRPDVAPAGGDEVPGHGDQSEPKTAGLPEAGLAGQGEHEHPGLQVGSELDDIQPDPVLRGAAAGTGYAGRSNVRPGSGRRPGAA